MRICDIFCYNGEEAILDIRLNVLDPYVDKFVICESEQTFSGLTKPIYYKGDNPKVIHIIAPNIETDNAFERAAYQKEYLKTALKDLKDDDVVYFGDVDEIWKPQEVDDKVYNLRQLNYSYYLNNRSSEEWVGTVVGKWGIIKTNSFNFWRANHTNELDNGGWHFTNIGGVEMIKRKLESYDHQEFNHDYIKNRLEYQIKNNRDYVGRTWDWKGVPFTFKVDESELPSYILDNKEKLRDYFK